MAFISRLMEEEGIRWYFEHSEDGHVLMLSDSTDHPPINDEPEIPYQPPSDLNVSEEHIYRFRLGQQEKFLLSPRVRRGSTPGQVDDVITAVVIRRKLRFLPLEFPETEIDGAP
jgi:hypothetical protein